MDFSISKDKLADALQKVNSVVGSKAATPVLGNALVEAEDGKIVLTTTDLDIRIKTEVACEVSAKGRTTVAARKLQEITRMLNQDTVRMTVDDGDRVSIECGASKFKINGLPAADFPLPVEVPALRRFVAGQGDFARMLRLISYAVTMDDTRKALNGLLISLNENNLTTVATDGRRLAVVEKLVDESTGSGGESILPVKSGLELLKLLGKEGKVAADIGEKMATFTFDDSTIMTTKLVEDVYPNYKQVIPASFARKVQLPRAGLTSSLLRVKSVVSERGYFVKLTFAADSLVLSGSSAEIGESSDSIKIAYDGPETSLSLNPEFLLQPLKELDSDDVTMRMNDGLNPVALTTEDGFLYVMMPMKNR